MVGIEKNLIYFVLFFIVFLYFSSASTFGIVFEDNFSYSSMDEFLKNWDILGDPRMLRLGNNSIKLLNDCSKTAWIRHYFENSLTNQTAFLFSALGKFDEGPYDSLGVFLVTNSTTYGWWGDGFYHKFVFSIGDEKEMFGKYSAGMNNIHNFTMMYRNRTLYLIFDGVVKKIKRINLDYENIKGVGVNSPWCGNSTYFLIHFVSSKTATYYDKINGSCVKLERPSLLFVGNVSFYSRDGQIFCLPDNFIGSFKVRCGNDFFELKNNGTLFEDCIYIENPNFFVKLYRNKFFRAKKCVWFTISAIDNTTFYELVKANTTFFILGERFNLFNHTSEFKDSCNILVVTTPDFPFAEKIAEKFDACLLVINETTNATKAKEEIINFIDELNKNGTFINSTDFYTKGVYLILIGNIPSFKIEDPVEKQKLLGLIEVSDKEDGEYFYSDLPYGDLNNDNYIDIPVSRYPNDEGISSLMLFYSDIYLPKNALVVSEYMHTNWLSILLNGGGNMWTGRTVANYLTRDGWKVSRLVEARMPEPEKFISQFNPLKLQDFMDKQQTLVNILEKLVGKTFSSVAGKILSILKIAQISENGFEAYLEYDWKSTKFDKEKFMNLLASLNLSENVPFEVAKVIVLSVWPNHWPILNKENLINYFNNSSAVFYLGFGNSTHLILPNEIPKDLGFLEWKEFFVDRYNGSEYLSYAELPIKFYKLVWNDASLSAFGNFGDEFRKRAETYIAPSALTYYHFSSEILTRFLKNEYTVGKALVKAINDFYDDRFTWDPFDVHRPGIKSKILREYFIFGSPTLFKDPEIDRSSINESLICSDFCTFSFSFKTNYSTVEIDNKTLVVFNDSETVFEEGKPIVNVKKIKFYLPHESNFSLQINYSTITIQNPYLPTLELTSTSGEKLNYSFVLNDTYPKENFYVHAHETVDGRKEITILVPLIKFNPNNTASIITQFNGILKYKPLIDFNLSLGNAYIGERNFFRIFVTNNLNESKEILIICNLNHQSFKESFEKKFEVEPGFTSLEIEKKLPVKGKYKLECYLKYNPVIGPRNLYFEAVSRSEEGKETKVISRNRESEKTVYYVAKYVPPELPNETSIIKTNVTSKTKENVSVCGNEICEANETFENCPEDCFVGPQPIEIENATNVSYSEKPTGFFVLPTNKLIGIILSIVVAVALVVLWLKR